MKYADFKKINLPAKSGVYFFKKENEILYIGKATNLRDRVRSYFNNDLIESRGMFLVDMVTKANTIEWIETDTVLEALLLEASLIKKHQPKYNTKEKDNKSFLCVVITDEKLPQVLLARQKDISKKQAKIKDKVYKITDFYGPFVHGGELRLAMKIIRKIFPYFDSSSIKKDNYEFYRQIGLTPDTTDENLVASYKQVIKNIKLFFEGKKKKIISNLKKEMNILAKDHKFEQAHEIKKRIFSIEHINDTSLIKSDLFEKGNIGNDFRIEAYDTAHLGGQNMVGVMVVVNGNEVDKKEYRQFNIKTVRSVNDIASLKEILSRRFSHPEWKLPSLIVVDGNDVQKKTAEIFLLDNKINIPVVATVKDSSHKVRQIIGDTSIVEKHKKAILLANSEAHRFSITLHRKKRSKSFLSK